MADLPIPFSAPMVLALLADRKTQTRRLLKADVERLICRSCGVSEKEFKAGKCICDVSSHLEWTPCEVPRYRVGDRLYVREAWRAQKAFDHLSPVEIGAEFEAEHGEPWCPTYYEADQRCDDSSIDMWQQSTPGRLRAGMHMPKWASRITLIVTDVRVQRLQDISTQDAKDEGIPEFAGDASHLGLVADIQPAWYAWDNRSTIENYRALWDDLNDKRAPWDSNPWVVAYTFTVHKQHIDRLPTSEGATT